MSCPLNGPRNISEFSYGGEFEDMPNPKQTSSKEWAKYVFYDHNPKGIVKEWWCHSATSYWFIAERNTITDEITKTYDPSEIYTKRVDFE